MVDTLLHMKKIKFLILLFILTYPLTFSNAQGLKAFKLPNGLSVYIWEDHTAPDVLGMVAVNVGSKEDPENYTGLAHYLEHMLFKGTQQIGALNWDMEAPIYEQIIQKYDEMAQTDDITQRKQISKEINQLTNEAAKYNLSNEFSNLTQGTGGKYLNAGTSYDYTVYFNSFPPGEIYKWLDLNSERLINPVFRSFQPELETVYEEFNRAQDQQDRRVREFTQSSIYPGHPYSRSVLGLPEHLKNPQLSELIKFYNTWYVPENMALILVGNVNTNEIVSTIKDKFGQLEKKALPERKQYPENQVKGRKEMSAKLSRFPQVMLAYPGITSDDEDLTTLEICTSILSNSSRTGLLDKLVIDGDIMSANAGVEALKERGSIKIVAIPHYDINQRRFESLKSTEKIILNEIKKLQEGQFENWLIESIKNEKIKNYDLEMEDSRKKANAIANIFITGQDMSRLLEYKEYVSSITVDKVKETAKKYFGSDYFALFINEGKPPKGEKLEKPDYDPIQPVRDAKSDYAKLFELMPVKHSEYTFANIDNVQIQPINKLTKLFYNKNPENEIFSLTLKFGIGTEKMPNLGLAVPLMNNAGIMGQLKSQEVKQEFSNLGASCQYFITDDYLYVVMRGFDTNLEESCNLLTRQVLLPQLDEKQLNNMKGVVYQQRRIEKTSTEDIKDALSEYLFYQEKSEYIDRPTIKEIEELTVSNLTGEFQRATDYEAEVHYVGTLPFETVYDILSKNLPLKQDEKASTSPEIRDRVNIQENIIYFVSNNDALQSAIHFYIQGDEYKKEDDVYREAFNQYFNGGFSGLVMQEIREYRSMAYTAGGMIISPPVENKKSYFRGSIGTQSDKTVEAIKVFMDLINNMPQYPDRLGNIKNYLKETALTDIPSFRDASITYENWKLRGYSQPPAKENMDKINNLTFDDIVNYYNKNIKGRPIAIAITGDSKLINLKELEQYGKIIKLSSSKLFNE